MGILTRFKSDARLQAEALDILTQMVRRDLLTVSVYITDPSVVLEVPVREAIVARSRTATQKEIVRELLSGEPIKKKRGPGIELLLNRQFRLATDDEARQLRDAIDAPSS